MTGDSFLAKSFYSCFLILIALRRSATASCLHVIYCACIPQKLNHRDRQRCKIRHIISLSRFWIRNLPPRFQSSNIVAMSAVVTDTDNNVDHQSNQEMDDHSDDGDIAEESNEQVKKKRRRRNRHKKGNTLLWSILYVLIKHLCYTSWTAHTQYCSSIIF